MNFNSYSSAFYDGQGYNMMKDKKCEKEILSPLSTSFFGNARISEWKYFSKLVQFKLLQFCIVFLYLYNCIWECKNLEEEIHFKIDSI